MPAARRETIGRDWPTAREPSRSCTGCPWEGEYRAENGLHRFAEIKRESQEISFVVNRETKEENGNRLVGWDIRLELETKRAHEMAVLAPVPAQPCLLIPPPRHP